MNKFRVSIIQYAPTYADIETNIKRHVEIIKKQADKSDLVIFPELSLTGYFLRDLTNRVMLLRQEVAKKINKLLKRKKLPDLIFGFVEEGESHNPYNSLIYLEHTPKGYRINYIHRKCFLPTYGMFEDARFFAPGRNLGVFETRFGKVGMLLCEDAWHPMSFYIEALKGAEIIVVGSASPARGVKGLKPYNLEHWDKLNSLTAATWATYIIYASRTGVEDSIVFSGGSGVFNPFGDKVASLQEVSIPDDKYEVLNYLIKKSEIGRAREITPLLRDENLALVSEEINRLKHNYYGKNK